MTFPDIATEIHGGCNCGAVRYKIKAPEFEQRPIHFMYGPKFASTDATTTTPARMPMIAVDHCNDCRSATSSILPCWILVPGDMFTISCLPRDVGAPGKINKSALVIRTEAREATRPPYMSARELLRGDRPEELAKTWLKLYFSTDLDAIANKTEISHSSIRSFCDRCGTNLTYVAYPMPDWYPDYVDVILGTVDRSFLEKEWMQPERQVHYQHGIPWVQNMSRQGLRSQGVLSPITPAYDIRIDISKDLQKEDEANVER